jgi:hypothetical protein
MLLAFCFFAKVGDSGFYSDSVLWGKVVLYQLSAFSAKCCWLFVFLPRLGIPVFIRTPSYGQGCALPTERVFRKHISYKQVLSKEDPICECKYRDFSPIGKFLGEKFSF